MREEFNASIESLPNQLLILAMAMMLGFFRSFASRRMPSFQGFFRFVSAGLSIMASSCRRQSIGEYVKAAIAGKERPTRCDL